MKVTEWTTTKWLERLARAKSEYDSLLRPMFAPVNVPGEMYGDGYFPPYICAVEYVSEEGMLHALPPGVAEWSALRSLPVIHDPVEATKEMIRQQVEAVDVSIRLSDLAHRKVNRLQDGLPYCCQELREVLGDMTVGNVTDSKFYLGIEFKPSSWFLALGPTYSGTKAGLVAGFGIGVLIAHIREVGNELG